MSSAARDIATPLSELVESTLKEGPQVVTKDGAEAAVLISIEDWRVIKEHQSWGLPSDRPSENPIDVLLDPNGPHDIYIPPRGRFKLRPPLRFED